ncbi:MAG TPA: DUF4845 domain-containing protein [Gammaproteobacteria bacterium]
MLRKSQQGVSFATVMLLAPLVGVFILVVIKLLPVYVENAAVKSVLQGVAGERAETYTTPKQVSDVLLKRLDINDVKHVNRDNLMVEREGAFYAITIEYEVRVPLFYNISIVTSFNNTGEVPAI